MCVGRESTTLTTPATPTGLIVIVINTIAIVINIIAIIIVVEIPRMMIIILIRDLLDYLGPRGHLDGSRLIIERVKPEDKGVYRSDDDVADAGADADNDAEDADDDDDDDTHFDFTIL